MQVSSVNDCSEELAPQLPGHSHCDRCRLRKLLRIGFDGAALVRNSSHKPAQNIPRRRRSLRTLLSSVLKLAI